jgi:predicted class III extradiol MEMO1 family dioxygenase
MKYKIVKSSDELYHFGIPGMKWGIRRYQNKDGSLTGNGKKRYRKQSHEDYTKAHSRKKVREMSDKELISRINRLQNEQNYDRLKKQNNKGRKFIKGYVATAGTIAAAAAATATYKKYGEELVNKLGSVAINVAYAIAHH